MLAHRLLITKVQFSLEASDWLSVTKIMLSFVARSLEAKTKQDQPAYLAQLRANIGELTDDEQLSQRILVQFT